MTYYIGQVDYQVIIGANNSRYFYAVRRDDDGELYFLKIDQLVDTSTITINNPGPASQDFSDFEFGVDFFDGRTEADHTRPYANLQWDQYRFDDTNSFYYVNDNGEFVVRENKVYSYPVGSQIG